MRFLTRSLDAVVSWSAMALLALPATVTSTSLGYKRPALLVNGIT